MIDAKGRHIALGKFCVLSLGALGACAQPPDLAYSFVVEQRGEEVAGADTSRVLERTFLHLTEATVGGEVRGVLRIDSVHFERDSQSVAVAPDRSPIATLSFTRDQAGAYVLDSLPSEVHQYPFIATVVIDLPLLRPHVPRHACKAGQRWSDSSQSHPVPVPGIDSLVERVSSDFSLDSLAGGVAFIQAWSRVVDTGSSASLRLDRVATRVAHWRVTDDCAGPAEADEEESALLRYMSGGNPVDSVAMRWTRTIRIVTARD